LTRANRPHRAGWRLSAILAVAALHVAILMLLIAFDHPILRSETRATSMILLRLDPSERERPEPVSRLPALINQTPMTWILPMPDIKIGAASPGPHAITPPLPGLPGGLDLSLHKEAPKKTQDDLMPSPEKRMAQFFADQAERNERENAKGPDGDDGRCFVVDNSRNTLAGTPSNGIGTNQIPDGYCNSQLSLKLLQRRNERYSPK
jgi:hypothetical protein